MIDSTEHLILHEERDFFRQATDEEPTRILLELRQELQLSAHSLIRAQQDIINYLNQIKNQVILVEKIRKVKYLQDQFELRARSNLSEIMERERSLLLEGSPQASFKLSPAYLASDEARPIILKVISNQKYREIVRKNEAGAFSEEDLRAQAMYEEVINLDEVVTAFLCSREQKPVESENRSTTFFFSLQYHFHREVDEKERTTFFCRLSHFTKNQLEIRTSSTCANQYEYAKIYPLWRIMDLNIQIPDNTASIFEYLQKGLFISSNSTSEEVRDMYNEIDENYEPLYQIFTINYTLERGNEYFFFSRIEPKATLEQKIMRAYYWIDVLRLFQNLR